MKLDISREIEIPEGFHVSIKDNEVKMVSNGKELVRNFDKGKVKMGVEGNLIKLSAKSATKRESKMIGTIWAHLNNMIKGLGEDFVYKLEVANVHFPMNVKVDGEKIVIKSFLGETTERVASIRPNTKVDVKGTDITVSSHDLEAAGQTAANIEKATRLTGRDRRIFQDGIFITEKPGRII